VIASRYPGDRALRAMAFAMLALVGVLASLRACHLIRNPSSNWHGPFGTVDYSRGGGLRHVVALERRDSR